MSKKILSFILLVMLAASSFCFAHAEEFSLRGGVKFGMSPDEVVAIEKSNGFEHDMTLGGTLLYKGKHSYQLYFRDKGVGNLGKMPIVRFEYDFDLTTQKLFQFYYVVDGYDAYNYLLVSLTQKYGAPTPNCTLNSVRFTEVYGSTGPRSRWELTYDNEIVLIDLWDTSHGTCFLVYQSFALQPGMSEQESLDFGL